MSFGAAHVKFEEELTLVGFVLDKKLTWKPMLNKVCSKGRQALGAMFRLKSLLDCSDLAILFKAFVRSTLEYGNLECFAGEHVCDSINYKTIVEPRQLQGPTKKTVKTVAPDCQGF